MCRDRSSSLYMQSLSRACHDLACSYAISVILQAIFLIHTAWTSLDNGNGLQALLTKQLRPHERQCLTCLLPQRLEMYIMVHPPPSVGQERRAFIVSSMVI